MDCLDNLINYGTMWTGEVDVNSKRSLSTEKQKMNMETVLEELEPFEESAIWRLYGRPESLRYAVTVNNDPQLICCYGLEIHDDSWCLYSTGPVVAKKEDLKKILTELLTLALQNVETDFRDKGPASRIFNRDGKATNCIRFLNRNLITTICEQFACEQFVA